MNLIGLDVGTTGCKAVLVSEDGEVLGAGYREYGIATDASGKAEQDAEEVWRLCLQALRTATDAAALRCGRRPEVAALSLSAQGDAIIPLDRSGVADRSACLGMDYRSAPAGARLRGPLRRRAAVPADRHAAAPDQLAVQGPVAPRGAARGMVSHGSRRDLRRLHPGAAGGARMDRRNHGLADHGLGPGDTAAGPTVSSAELGLASSLFARAVPSGTVIGRLAPTLARELGLAGEVQLVSGAHDQVAGAVGAGVLEEGEAVISTGTAEVLSTTFVSAGAPPALYSGFYPCYASALPGRRFTFALNHVGGLLLRWYRDTWAAAEVAEAASSGRDPYEVILSGLPAGPSPVLFLPHLNGAGTPTCDTLSMGAIVGLTLSTDRADVVRAMLECQSLRAAAQPGSPHPAAISVRRVTAVGGGARSPVWLQVKADVLGIPVRTIRVNEAACLGAAVLAGAGAAALPLDRPGRPPDRPVRYRVPSAPLRPPAYGRRYADLPRAARARCDQSTHV